MRHNFKNLEEYLYLLEANLGDINTQRALIVKRFKELCSIPQDFGVENGIKPELEIPLVETLEKIKLYRSENYQKLKKHNPKLLHELNCIIDYLTKGDFEAPYEKIPINPNSLEMHPLNFGDEKIDLEASKLQEQIQKNKRRLKKRQT